MDIRQKLYELTNQRSGLLQDAENALTANNQADYTAAMDKITKLNKDIQNYQTLVAEQDRQILNAPPPSGSEAQDMAHERATALLRGDAVTFTTNEVRRFLYNQTTLATGTLVEPVGAGSTINDKVGSVVPSIVDRVRTMDLTGISAYQEPYVITELDANGGKVEETAGTKRKASTSPTFGVSQINPYEMSVTDFVDRNISRLSTASYYEKIYSMAMKAMRRMLAKLIVNGDDPSTPTFFGITNAKNKAGAAISATQALGSAVDVNTLDELYFAYGSDETLGGNARLLLTKPVLKALGKLRGTNEKRRLFEIVHDTGNANSGIIQDGGMALPYDLVSAVSDTKLLYGDPANYLVGLFGDYTVRVDESAHAEERLLTILGDAMVGGNLVVDKGFVVGTIGE